jgi:carbon storage regulator
MLVLTRKQGEKIRIGDDVVITVVRTKGKAVRLGIQAPAHVPVLRGEIAVAIGDETRRANETAGGEPPDGDGPDERSDGEKARSEPLAWRAGAASATTPGSPLGRLVQAHCS